MSEVAWKKVGLLADIPLRGARRLCFGHDGHPIAVFRTGANTFFALIDECPHRAGPLSEGIVAGETVTCPLHNWVIDLKTGAAAAPDDGNVRSLPVRLEEGEIYVGIPLRETA
jgi:nitrite reductase (NADH) small subunit